MVSVRGGRRRTNIAPIRWFFEKRRFGRARVIACASEPVLRGGYPMSIGWFGRRRASRATLEGVLDGDAPRALFRRASFAVEARGRTWIVGPSARGSEYGTPSSMTSAPASSRIASAFSVASRLGSPAQMKGTNAHWLRFFKAAKVSPMDAVAVAVSAAARTGAAREVRRVATAERVASLTPARGEAAKAVAAIVVRSRTIGSARLRSRGGTRTTGACVGGRHLRCRAGVRTLVSRSARPGERSARGSSPVERTRFRLQPPTARRITRGQIAIFFPRSASALKQLAVGGVQPV
jgi:hypothetical protein